MFTEKAIEALKELHRSENLPPYNEVAIAKTKEEIDSLYSVLIQALNENQEAKTTEYIMAHSVIYRESIYRNKRCILAYLMERTNRIRNYRWTSGSAILPNQLKEHMSQNEIKFFTDYDKILTNLHTKIGLDLTVDVKQPPKELYIEVRVLKEMGEVVLNSGSTVSLNLNTTHFVRRSDVETMITQGILEHIV
eukprot:gene4982-6203_t